MNFYTTKLEGVYLVEPERMEDERGFFARTWCAQEFRDIGLNPTLIQCNVSFNRKRGTVRGLHYQAGPQQEAKLIRCTQGALYDVIVDVRPDSSTFKQWEAFELTAENRRMVFASEGLAHGFQSLVDGTEIFYQMSHAYCPSGARGIHYLDPELNIPWPLPCVAISAKDQNLPQLRQASLADDFAKVRLKEVAA